MIKSVIYAQTDKVNQMTKKIKKETWFKAGVLVASWGVGIAAAALGFPYLGYPIIASGTAYATGKPILTFGKKLLKGKIK